MRTLRFVVLAAALLVVEAAPVGAAPPPNVGLTISPVGGTPGTTISVSGPCSASEGDAYLEYPLRSDAIPPPVDHVHFTTTNGRYATTLHNSVGNSNGFPNDLNVRVWCDGSSAEAAFHASDTPMGTTPTIFASLGETPCGFAYLPDPAADNRIPCPEHLKGFTSRGALTTNFYRHFDQSFGASIAVGDVNGDGEPDIVSGSGRGAPGTVMVTKLDGSLLATAHVYGDFAGGAYVAVGDVTGDGHNEVVTGAGPGGGPHVLVLSFDGSEILNQVGSFYAYDPGFHGGVNVAVGKFDSRFVPEIVTGPGPGGGPDVRRFRADGTIRGSFYAYDPHFGGGVSVATIPESDGLGRIVTGAGAGGGPHVKVFPSSGLFVYAGFYAYDPSFSGGVSVAVGQIDGATRIVTGAGPGGGPHIRTFNLDGSLYNGGFYAFDQCCGAGVRVAAAP